MIIMMLMMMILMIIIMMMMMMMMMIPLLSIVFSLSNCVGVYHIQRKNRGAEKTLSPPLANARLMRDEGGPNGGAGRNLLLLLWW